MKAADVLDRRIAELESHIARLEAERERLLAGREAAPGEGAMLKALLESFDERRELEGLLHSAQEWLHLAQLVGGVAAYSFDIATRTNDWSVSTKAMYGLPSDVEISFERWLDCIHSDDRPAVLGVVQATLERGEDPNHVFRIVRGDGEIRYILDRGRVFRDAAGKAVRLVGINIDITEQRQIQDELHQSSDFLEAMLAASDDCVKVIDAGGRLIYMSENGRRIMDIDDFAQVDGQRWSALWPAEMQRRLDRAVNDALNGQRTQLEGACPTAKGTMKHWEVTISPISDSTGKVSRVVAVSRDITDEVDARTRTQLINRELHHRIRNSLATVQALARSTARQASDLDAFQETFDARMESLSNVHELLGTAGDSVELRAIVMEQLAPYLGSLPVRVDGPDVLLKPERAVAMAMIIHELTTNACKYGGLSDKGEGIDISWSLTGAEGSRILLTWQERPSLAAKPGKTGGGFGTRLVSGLVASDLRGTIATEHGDEGYRVTIEWPRA